MRLQTKKIRKISKIVFFKGLILPDLIWLFIFFIDSYLISFQLVAFNQDNLIKTGLFALFFVLQMPLIKTYHKHQAKGYTIIFRAFRYLVGVKKYKENKDKKGNLKNIIPYGKIEKDYVYNKNNQTVFGALKIKGKDITRENKENQTVFRDNLTEFFNRITNKITIVKLPKKVNLDINLDNLKKYKALINEKTYNAWKESIEKHNSSALVDEYYIIVYAKSVQELENEIEKLLFELYNSRLDAQKLDLNSLLKLINEIFFFSEELNFDTLKEKVLDIKSAEFKKDYFKLDNIFYSTQTIAELPLILKNDWIWKLFNSPSVVIWNLATIDKETLAAKLNATERNAELNLAEQKNRFFSRKQKNEMTALDNLSNVASLENENILESTMIFLSKSNNLTYLKKVKSINENNIKSIVAKIDNLIYRQFEGLSAVFFRGADNLREFHEQIASNISYGWPFIMEYFNDKTFPLIGINNNTSSPFFFDPRIKEEQRTNHNMFVLGEPGRGKTTFTKKIMLSNLAKGDEVIIIDPQNEFSEFVKEMKGQIINLGSGNDIVINPLQIRKLFSPKSKEFENTFNNQELLELHENFMRSWLKIIYSDFKEKDIRFIILNLHKIYEKYNFRNLNKDISTLDNKEYPLMTELIEEMKETLKSIKSEKEIAEKKEIIETFELDFINGRFSKKFNNYSTIEFNNKLICFNVSSLMYQEKNVFNSTFYLLISYLQGKISNQYHKNNKIWFVIDEAHKFIDEENMTTLKFIYTTIKEGRKFQVGTILTTQQPQDFTKTPSIEKMGQAIVESCQYAAIFTLKAESINNVNRLFENIGGLTHYEKQRIALSTIGECLLMISINQRFQIKVDYNQEEQNIFFVKNQQINTKGQELWN